MWRRFVVTYFILSALLSISVALVKAQQDKMTLGYPEVFGKKDRPAVVFTHNAHAERGLSCKDCHHRYENGKNVLDESELQEGSEAIRCSACHPPQGLQKAFHRQCIGCHRQQGGPRFCGQCHRR